MYFCLCIDVLWLLFNYYVDLVRFFVIVYGMLMLGEGVKVGFYWVGDEVDFDVCFYVVMW